MSARVMCGRATAGLMLVALLGGCEKQAPTVVELSGAPATLATMSGSGQVATPGAQLVAPLVAQVTDADGRPVPAVQIRWRATSGTIQAIDSTDNDGQSIVQWTLGDRTGQDTAFAQVGGVDGLGTAVFVATARAIAPTSDFLFRYVEVGTYHACGILTNERGVCWGFNGDGQLGTGTFASSAAPALSGGDLVFRMTSAGRYHTCGVTLGGQAYCWGNGADGRIGGPAGSNSATPVQIRATTGAQLTFRSIGTGLLHSCGLTVSQEVWCWGFNGEGELGTSPTITPGAWTDQATYVGADYRALAVGGLHTCALTTAGDANCWGFNSGGQLGNGGSAAEGRPVAVSSVMAFRTDAAAVPQAPAPDFYVPASGFLTAGYSHSCGIRTDNTAVCWGMNENGQLGTGGTAGSAAPAAVAGGLAFARLSAGYRHTCGITTAGAAYCWGANELGQLGDGTRTARMGPTAVAGGLTFQSISAGELSTCGVTADGVAYCWGDNEYDQLGTEGGSVTVPTKVATQP